MTTLRRLPRLFCAFYLFICQHHFRRARSKSCIGHGFLLVVHSNVENTPRQGSRPGRLQPFVCCRSAVVAPLVACGPPSSPASEVVSQQPDFVVGDSWRCLLFGSISARIGVGVAGNGGVVCDLRQQVILRQRRIVGPVLRRELPTSGTFGRRRSGTPRRMPSPPATQQV